MCGASLSTARRTGTATAGAVEVSFVTGSTVDSHWHLKQGQYCETSPVHLTDPRPAHWRTEAVRTSPVTSPPRLRLDPRPRRKLEPVWPSRPLARPERGSPP